MIFCSPSKVNEDQEGGGGGGLVFEIGLSTFWAIFVKCSTVVKSPGFVQALKWRIPISDTQQLIFQSCIWGFSKTSPLFRGWFQREVEGRSKSHIYKPRFLWMDNALHHLMLKWLIILYGFIHPNLSSASMRKLATPWVLIWGCHVRNRNLQNGWCPLVAL